MLVAVMGSVVVVVVVGVVIQTFSRYILTRVR